MEKYKSLTTITDKYLDGKLIELDIRYNNDNEIHLEVLYQFNSFMKLCYELNVNINDKEINFLSHGSNGAFDKVRLGREENFEIAVQKLFFA